MHENWKLKTSSIFYQILIENFCAGRDDLISLYIISFFIHNCSSNFKFDTLRHEYEMNHFIIFFFFLFVSIVSHIYWNMLMSISWKITYICTFLKFLLSLPLLLVFLFFEHNTWALRIGSSIYRSSSTYGKTVMLSSSSSPSFCCFACINERKNLNFMQVSTFIWTLSYDGRKKTQRTNCLLKILIKLTETSDTLLKKF